MGRIITQSVGVDTPIIGLPGSIKFEKIFNNSPFGRLAGNSTGLVYIDVNGVIFAYGAQDSSFNTDPNGLTAHPPANLKKSKYVAFGSGIGNGPCIAVHEDGTITEWGYRQFYLYYPSYQLNGWQGGGSPTLVGENSNFIKVVGAGSGAIVTEFVMIGLKSNGDILSWGIMFAVNIPLLNTFKNAKDIAAGRKYVIILKNDGTVTNGTLNASNVFQRFVAGSTGNSSLANTQIPAELTNVSSIVGGEDHVLALKGDGTVVAWGKNTDGQSTVPVGLNNVVQIAAGYDHSLALKSDGTVVAWGKNTNGQCNIPTSATNIASIYAWGNSSGAISNYGEFIFWGLDTWSTNPNNPFQAQNWKRVIISNRLILN